TLDWSHQLLDERERELFAALAVFSGGFTVEHAAAVAGATVDGLEALASMSLLVRVPPRLAMLETVRGHAPERRREGGGEDDVRRRHAEVHAALAEESAGRGTAESFGALELEHDNLRAALDWAAAAGDAPLEVRLLVAMRQFWLVRGYLEEGRGFF